MHRSLVSVDSKPMLQFNTLDLHIAANSSPNCNFNRSFDFSEVLIYSSGVLKDLRSYSKSIFITFQCVLPTAQHMVATLLDLSNAIGAITDLV